PACLARSAGYVTGLLLDSGVLRSGSGTCVAAFHRDGEVGGQRRDGADGGPHRQEYGADDSQRQRDLDENLAVVVLDGDAPDVALVHEFAHLGQHGLSRDPELLGAASPGLGARFGCRARAGRGAGRSTGGGVAHSRVAVHVVRHLILLPGPAAAARPRWPGRSWQWCQLLGSAGWTPRDPNVLSGSGDFIGRTMEALRQEMERQLERTVVLRQTRWV